IGRPVDGLRVWLLDRDGRRVPPGVPGELCVGGRGLARGYRGRPDLTAERFVPDPWGDGTRLYRTGDLARWRGGELEFLGRIDHQVKIRGFRIEPGEIEAVLREHPGVREAVVTVRERAGEGVLVAYVAGEGDLAGFLSGRLPIYMVPSAFVLLPSLPLTPNGKVDLRALPEPEWGEGQAEDGAPSTPLEEALAGIWATVLDLPEVGVHENFFKLGGHSLMATRVLSRVRDAVGAEVPLAALFEAPTVAGLARAVEERLRGAGLSEGPIPRRAADGPAPLSFAQERLWFLDQLTPGLTAYSIVRAFRLRGPLDTRALAAAAAGVIRHHEALRTTFAAVDGRPVQVIAPEALPEIGVEDVEAQRPFDLQAGPLLRLAVARLGPDDHRLTIAMHHIVSDGWSMGLFFRELSALYRGGDLPELPIQYADFAAWQRERLSGDRLAALVEHWRRELSGAPALLELPADRPRPPVQSWRGGQAEVDLPPELARGLRGVARRSGATLFMTLLAGLAALCSRYTGRRDVVLGSPVAGRNRSETEGLIGLFVNNLVLRLRWDGDPGLAGLIGKARRATLSAHAHQDLPFEKLVAELAPERSLGHTPFFQVVLSTQSRAAEALDLPGIAPEALPVDRAESRFDLELAVIEGGPEEGLRVLWRYDRDLFDPATAARMAGHFANLLAAAQADPDRRLSDLPLLAAEERAQLLGWNGGAAAFPVEGCLHDLFAARAKERPEAVAVVCEGNGLTWRELDEASNRLARFLAGLGVRPGDRVGLCLERSLDLVVAILAVLKTGAAYLPLDPAHPAERQAFTLEDGRVSVLLDQERLEAGREEIG
ncbi:MAG: condensation domain-containing protein, partial [Thermoanaerobaculia bacterium]